MRAAISPMLVRLAEERATGVLTRDHGALFLVDGQVVHAESPAAPGLDVLLTASGRLRPDHWAEAVAQAGERGEVARHLVDSGRLAGGELEICHLAALHDAAFFALAPAGGPTRFRYGVCHWLGRVRPVPPRAVEREALRRARLLDAVWPHPSVDTAPVRRRGLGGRVVSPRRRGLLELADGVRTPAAIACELGRPAFHTLVEVRRLAAEGYIDTPEYALPAPVALAPPPDPGPAPGPRPPVPPGPVPYDGPSERTPSGAAADSRAAAVPGPLPRRGDGGPGPEEAPSADPADPALLRRIRDALEDPR